MTEPKSGLKLATITDAKSLYDHACKIGSMPVPRQTLIDLLVAKDLIEQEAIMFKRLPKSHMLADVLMKTVQPNVVLLQFLLHGVFSTLPTEQQEDELLIMSMNGGLARIPGWIPAEVGKVQLANLGH